MSTVEPPQVVATPPLVAGDRLDAATFHQRYEAMPSKTRAELVDGVVYMPSPLFPDHGRESRVVNGWLTHYEILTPGIRGEDNTSTRLDQTGEVQPDHNLRVRPDRGGQTGTAREYIVGAPGVGRRGLAVEPVGSTSGRRRAIRARRGRSSMSSSASIPTRCIGSSGGTAGSSGSDRGRTACSARPSSPGSGSTRPRSMPRTSLAWSRPWTGGSRLPSMPRSSPGWSGPGGGLTTTRRGNGGSSSRSADPFRRRWKSARHRRSASSSAGSGCRGAAGPCRQARTG